MRFATTLFLLCTLAAGPDLEAAQSGSGAGTAVTDITPPAGLSTGGHGPQSAIARGHLTRLYARAIVLRTATQPLVLVSIEAFASSAAFPLAIREHLSRSQGVDIPLANIVVAATHTHHGPANYSSSRVYNDHASRIHGFDRATRDFLVGRILQAVDAAWNDAASSASVRLQVRVGAMGAAWRNRSPETFLLNRDAADVMAAMGTGLPESAAACESARLPREPGAAWDVEGCPRLRAVERTVTVIELWRNGRKKAALVFAAVHPTVLPATAPLFSSDFAGLAMKTLERTEPDQDVGYVAAFFNGAQGDIVPRRVARDLRELDAHARLLVDAIRSATNTESVDLASGITARMHTARAGEVSPIDTTIALAPQARPGAAALGGAEDDRTPLYDLGWREGVRADRARNGQGTKQGPLESRLLAFLPDLTAILANPRDYPSTIPLSLVQIGTLDFAILPAEMSATGGHRLRTALAAAGRRALVVGLANDYASYIATADEYALQDYMGASTLWGPRQSEFVIDVVRHLGNGGKFPKSPKLEDRPGPKAKAKPYDVGQARPAIDEGLDLILRDDTGRPVRNLPLVSWTECDASAPYEDTGRRRIEIIDSQDVVIDNDAEGRLITLLTESPRGGTRKWAAIWTGRLYASQAQRLLRFRITLPGGAVRLSTPFDARDHRGLVEDIGCAVARR